MEAGANVFGVVTSLLNSRPPPPPSAGKCVTDGPPHQCTRRTRELER